MSSPSDSISILEEQNWIIQIRQTLNEELEDDNYHINVSIFNVPKTLLSAKPSSYTPQQVALGPYHYCNPDLYDMGRYKLAAAKNIKKQVHGIKFQQVVNEFVKLEPRIRACYHKFLNFNNEALAWIMAVDACFLLEFLQNYTNKDGNSTLTEVTSSESPLVDSPRKKEIHNAILRDIVMLENQIPLFLLRKILDYKYSSSADEVLNSLLMNLCQDLSSFKIKEDISSIHVSECAHLLDYLYKTIVPKIDIPSQIIEAEDSNESIKEDFDEESKNESHNSEIFKGIWKILSKVNAGPIIYLKKALVSKPIELLRKLPWNVITRIPGFSILKKPVDLFCSSESKEDTKTEEQNGENSSKNNINKAPLIHEITIPSVTQLYKSGVKFLPAKGDITTITFDEKTVTLYLPIISLDINTEVLLRNLVAYEASTASGPLVLARYTELMNGIIDTEEDAKFLRSQGIVVNRLKSDKEVVNLWNGMNESVKLTQVPFLDKLIEDVNKYYDGRWKVKIGKCMKEYVYDSWKVLTLLAAILFLFLTILQSFCSVYSCGRFFDDV